MATYLIERGVPAERIVVELEATSTNENLENAHRLAPDAVLHVVTNDFHVLRTALWAWHLGIAVHLHSARTPWRLMPRNYLREVLATPHSAARIVWRRMRGVGFPPGVAARCPPALPTPKEVNWRLTQGR